LVSRPERRISSQLFFFPDQEEISIFYPQSALLTPRSCAVPLDDARACFETNLFGVISITQSFIPLLIACKGLIIIGSLAGIVPYVFGSVYNASKAALHAYSRTLRLELEPFDVRVMVVVTGGVQSNIARTHRILPNDSLYLDIVEDFERRQTHSQEGAMGHDDYARGVVNAALKKKPVKWLWRGKKAWLVWFVRAVSILLEISRLVGGV
jgi:1-acylglycerone phosphate reductase